MSLMDRYHVLVHDVSALFGYDYNDTTPDWVHPFIHLILVLAPGLLIGVALYLVLRGIYSGINNVSGRLTSQFF